MSTLLGVENSRCDENCYNAKNPECECICGGRNHGVGFEAASGQANIFNVRVTISKEEFYKDRRRERSPELDFGVFWYDGKRHPAYRVTWIDATGELYAFNQSNEQIEVLGVIEGRDEVEGRLKGWADVCGKINSLSWVRGCMS